MTDPNKQPNAPKPPNIETLGNLMPGQVRIEIDYPQQDDYKHLNDDPATPPTGHVSVSGDGDHEPKDKEVKNLNFSDENIRKGFVRRVYSTLTCQFLIALGAICLFLYYPLTAQWAQDHHEVFVYAFVMWVIMIITMFCFDTAIRKFPVNVIFLFILTLVDSFVLATAASSYNLEELVVAVGIMGAVCFILILFTFQSKFKSGYFFIVFFIVLSSGIIAYSDHFGLVKALMLIYGLMVITFGFSQYLIADTNVMMEGRHKYKFNPDEYIFASLNLYLDIFRVFWFHIKKGYTDRKIVRGEAL